jgi:putative spermidine/putrescine transport system ATP-binding protein
MATVQIDRIEKHYGGYHALKTVDFTVEDGEFVVLVGPSGCGKSTLLRCIAGLEDISRGAIRIGGRDVTGLEPRDRDIAMVFQSYALYPHMTVRDNMAFSLDLKRTPKAEIDARVQEAADILGIGDYLDRKPRALSGGQRQRVAMGRAIVRHPQVFLFDEPLSNLDAKLREVMQIELRRIQQQVGITTIMVTHDQAEALSISDRVMVMEKGRATQYDTPLNVYESPQSPFISTFVGKANMFKGTALIEGEKCFATVSGMKLALDIDLRDGHCPHPGQELILSLRPEKLRFAEPGRGFFDAQVEEKFFFGSQWHYTVTSPLGTLMVLQPNDGRQPINIGDNLSIGWGESCVRIVPDSENLGIVSAT